VLKACSDFVGGVIRSGDSSDMLECTAQASLHIAKAQSEGKICGRFSQKSRRFRQSGATGARYANRAEPHKHWRLRISLIWHVGT
jgi:hypothetical protein